MKITGAQAIVNVLLEQGIDTIFGYPGGQVIPLFDALYDAPLRSVLPVHEQGGIHAADGYARASGKTGVCIVTSGPGATNVVTGLATAYLDSIPLVVISGQVSRANMGRDAFQEVDIISVSLAITKHSIFVSRPEDLVSSLREAFKVARAPRSGPVIIDVPSDIQTGLVDWYEHDELDDAEDFEDDIIDTSLIKEAADLISAAKQPVMLVGGGAIQADCSWAIKELAEQTNMPVISTLMGLGAFPGNHDQFLGMSGMHGQKAANLAINESDVVVVIGSRFSERVTGDRSKYVKNKKIIQFDIDPSELDKNVSVALPIVANLANAMAMLAAEVERRLDIDDWWKKIKTWQSEYSIKVRESDLNPYWIFREINKIFQDEDVIFVSDVGQNQMWAAQSLCVKEPRTHLTSGGCGTMGFSMPAAVGASIARPRSRVIQIAGDGGFKMTGMELFTAVNEKLPIISIVLNNHSLGMVRQWQDIFYNKRFSSTVLKEFDFISFASSCGAKALQAKTQKEFINALMEAKKHNEPFFIEAIIPDSEMVSPMVAPGAAIDEFVEFA